MEIPILGNLNDCNCPNELIIIQSGKPENNLQKNQLLRINKNLATKGLKLNDQQFNCVGDTLAILLVDKRHQLRGTYLLEQSEINRLFAELDILLMNESYGEGVSR